MTSCNGLGDPSSIVIQSACCYVQLCMPKRLNRLMKVILPGRHVVEELRIVQDVLCIEGILSAWRINEVVKGRNDTMPCMPLGEPRQERDGCLL